MGGIFNACHICWNERRVRTQRHVFEIAAHLHSANRKSEKFLFFLKVSFACLWLATFWRIKIILTCLIYNAQNSFFPLETSSQIYSWVVFFFAIFYNPPLNLNLNKVSPWAKQPGRRLQKWCHPKTNPGAATKTLNNETSPSTLWQHRWWFYWHMERSHSCKPCGQKLCNLVDAAIAQPKFYLPTRSTSVWMWVDRLQETVW